MNYFRRWWTQTKSGFLLGTTIILLLLPLATAADTVVFVVHKLCRVGIDLAAEWKRRNRWF